MSHKVLYVLNSNKIVYSKYVLNTISSVFDEASDKWPHFVWLHPTSDSWKGCEKGEPFHVKHFGTLADIKSCTGIIEVISLWARESVCAVKKIELAADLCTIWPARGLPPEVRLLAHMVATHVLPLASRSFHRWVIIRIWDLGRYNVLQCIRVY